MPVKVITAPTEYPVTLAEAKTHAKATSDTGEDAEITLMIAGATELFEHETGRTVASRTMELTLDNFPEAIKLQHPPVQSVVSIKYDDIDNIERTLSSLDYKLDKASDQRGWVTPVVGKVWPDTYAGAINAVRVQYLAGWASASVVPADVKLWIKMHVTNWFENRTAYTQQRMIRQPGLDGIVGKYRIFNL